MDSLAQRLHNRSSIKKTAKPPTLATIAIAFQMLEENCGIRPNRIICGNQSQAITKLLRTASPH